MSRSKNAVLISHINYYVMIGPTDRWPHLLWNYLHHGSYCLTIGWSINAGWVSIAVGYEAAQLGFDSQQGQEILYSIASTPALGPTQSPIQCVLVTFPRVKWLGCRADHSPPSSAMVKNGGAVLPLHIHLFSFHQANPDSFVLARWCLPTPEARCLLLQVC
jgi:hypothetical protein